MKSCDASLPSPDFGQPPSSSGGFGSSAADLLLFDAVLRPNRSLNECGFRIMMILVVAVAVIAGSAFVAVGAWPVFGFFGVDILLLYFAFRINYRRGFAYETLQLTRDWLVVRAVRPDGSAGGAWMFQTAWLRVRLERPDNRLILSSHGRAVSVGGFLTPAERTEVAHALRSALSTCRVQPALS